MFTIVEGGNNNGVVEADAMRSGGHGRGEGKGELHGGEAVKGLGGELLAINGRDSGG